MYQLKPITNRRKPSVLILGASGMLGHTLFSQLHRSDQYDAWATTRRAEELDGYFQPEMLNTIVGGVDAVNFDSIIRVVKTVGADCIINCIGIIKQRADPEDCISSLAVNALFPQKLALLCKAEGVRVIHISTDCVFDGSKGNYCEEDVPTAVDLYGRTKFLGELNYPHCTTLRTSIVGHELNTKYGLVEWFLSQTGRVNGFTRAIFSGVPSVELADIIINHVLPAQSLRGLYHVSAAAISKYDLLRKIARQYGIATIIEPCSDVVVDRSLDSSHFRRASGYRVPDWDVMVKRMYDDFITKDHYRERQPQ